MRWWMQQTRPGSSTRQGKNGVFKNHLPRRCCCQQLLSAAQPLTVHNIMYAGCYRAAWVLTRKSRAQLVVVKMNTPACRRWQYYCLMNESKVWDSVICELGITTAALLTPQLGLSSGHRFCPWSVSALWTSRGHEGLQCARCVILHWHWGPLLSVLPSSVLVQPSSDAAAAFSPTTLQRLQNYTHKHLKHDAFGNICVIYCNS